MYLPSTLLWTGTDGSQLALTQSGNYPLEGTIALRVEASRPEEFSLRLRIPSWTQASIRINGSVVRAPVQKGFVTLSRRWKSGDRIDLRLNLPMRLEPIDEQHPNTVALVRGPLVLFPIGEDGPRVSKEDLLIAKRAATKQCGKLRN